VGVVVSVGVAVACGAGVAVGVDVGSVIEVAVDGTDVAVGGTVVYVRYGV
jgi:hypothetical protein